jgi:aryl-alcohol dehydrogenase-like predicted oxidoreductase
VTDVAGQTGATPAQVALAWLLHQPTVTAPIIGASRIAHLEQAVGAVELELSDDHIAQLTRHYTPRPVLEHS